MSVNRVLRAWKKRWRTEYDIVPWGVFIPDDAQIMFYVANKEGEYIETQEIPKDALEQAAAGDQMYVELLTILASARMGITQEKGN